MARGRKTIDLQEYMQFLLGVVLVRCSSSVSAAHTRPSLGAGLESHLQLEMHGKHREFF